jgi:hypothetical protein
LKFWIFFLMKWETEEAFVDDGFMGECVWECLDYWWCLVVVVLILNRR